MLVEIGALVEKHSGQQILQTVKDADGVICITLESGRSSDLIFERQFGDFGETAIVSILAESSKKEQVFSILFEACELEQKQQGLIFMTPDIIKSSMPS
tara:strand:- start:73 stop:369 length:297 start_codon:yes stop_codon:yes gene_type:complete